jgi:hypothetical protein
MSTIKKPAIPGTSMLDPQLAPIIGALKENVELITGARGPVALAQLPASATLAEVIQTLNVIVQRINAAGE